MPLLRDDPAASSAVLYAVAQVEAARTRAGVDVPFTGPDPGLVPFAMAEVAAIACEEVDRLGGDSAALLVRIWLAVSGGNGRSCHD